MKRWDLLSSLLRSNRQEYIETVTFFQNTIPRTALPNVQGVDMGAESGAPIPSSLVNNEIEQDMENSLIKGSSSSETASLPPLSTLQTASLLPLPLTDDCTLTNVTYTDSPIDRLFMRVFRGVVQVSLYCMCVYMYVCMRVCFGGWCR